MSNHFKKICGSCQYVISQCRCPGLKQTLYDICQKCAPAGMYNECDRYELSQEETLLVNLGKKIQAIKMLRERVGCGLKVAKDSVEAYTPHKPVFSKEQLVKIFWEEIENSDVFDRVVERLRQL